MAESFFMFVAEAVAGELAPKRAGARHALMLFILASDLEAAQIAAIEKAEARGWLFVDLKRGKEASKDVDDFPDEVLRGAAQAALDNGFDMVIYGNEISLDA